MAYTSLLNLSDNNHSHTIDDVTNLSTELDNIKNADVKTHTHSITDVTGLQDSLNSMSSPIVKLSEVTMTSSHYNIEIPISNQREYKMLKLILIGIDALKYDNTPNITVKFNNANEYYYYSGYYFYNGTQALTKSTGSATSIDFLNSGNKYCYMEFSLYPDKYYNGYCNGYGGHCFLAGTSSITYSDLTKITIGYDNHFAAGTKCIVYGYK